MEKRIDALRQMIQRTLKERTEALETLREAVEVLQGEISRFEKDIEFYQRNLDAIAAGRFEVTEHGIAIAVEEREERRFSGKSIADASGEILKEAGTPLHVSEIWKRISEGGITSRAKRPTVSVAAALIRDERFENIGRNTFRIKGGTQQEFGI